MAGNPEGTGRSRQGTEQGEARVSRRRLLQLAAYGVPAMQILSVAGSSRALAQSPPCPGAVLVRPAGPNEIGYQAIHCATGAPHQNFDPSHCDWFEPIGHGQGFVFELCNSPGSLWDPPLNVCYRFADCPQLQGCLTPVKGC